MRSPWWVFWCMTTIISSRVVHYRPERSHSALIRHWSLIQIGATTPLLLDQWQIISQEFRENLEWAIVVPGDAEISPAVTSLLDGLAARGITIHNSRFGPW